MFLALFPEAILSTGNSCWSNSLKQGRVKRRSWYNMIWHSLMTWWNHHKRLLQVGQLKNNILIKQKCTTLENLPILNLEIQESISQQEFRRSNYHLLLVSFASLRSFFHPSAETHCGSCLRFKAGKLLMGLICCQKRFPPWNGCSFSNIVIFVKDKNVSFAIGFFHGLLRHADYWILDPYLCIDEDEDSPSFRPKKTTWLRAFDPLARLQHTTNLSAKLATIYCTHQHFYMLFCLYICWLSCKDVKVWSLLQKEVAI